jgi:hypothetical protein
MKKNFQISGILVVVDPELDGYESYVASVRRTIYHIVVIGGGDSVKDMYRTLGQLRRKADRKEAVWMDKLLNNLSGNQSLERTSASWPVIPQALRTAIRNDEFSFGSEDKMMYVDAPYVMSFHLQGKIL